MVMPTIFSMHFLRPSAIAASLAATFSPFLIWA